jgi:putative peptidoglycan lipid II flippase
MPTVPLFPYLTLYICSWWGGALSSAFIPIFSAFVVTGREDEGWKSASIVFNYVVVFLLVLILIAYLYTKPLMVLLAPGLPAEYLEMAVELTHIMFLQTFFMALNGFAMGILNSYKHFVAPALGSLVYNLVIIIVGASLVDRLGIAAFSYGVVLGAFLNFVVQIPALRRMGLKYYFSFDYRNIGFRQIMVLMVPVLAGLGVVQLNLFVTQNLSSNLGSGVISALNLSQRIMNLPIGIFAVSIATALFPTLTAFTAVGELDDFKRSTSLGLRAIFLVSIPASFGLIALGEPLIKLLFEQGEFTSSMVTATNQALVFYSIGLFAYSAVQVLNRSFYALKDTLTPVVAAFLTIGFNIYLSLNLVDVLGHRGLAGAYSLAGFLNMVLLLGMLRIKVGILGGYKLIRSFSISMGASLVMFSAVRLWDNLLTTWWISMTKLGLLVYTMSAITIGIIVYSGIVLLFRLEETDLVWSMVGKRLPDGIIKKLKRY